jgi:hypothetical protein
MADHVTNPAGNAENAVKTATEAIATLKKIRPRNDLEARSLCAQILQANELLVDASKTAIQAAVAQRATSNGHAKSRGLGETEIMALAKALVPFLKKQIADATAPLLARIAELEARPQMAYEGVWDATKAYTAGSFVTHQGSLWFAEDTSLGVRPGAGSSAWKLAVKRGKADR